MEQRMDKQTRTEHANELIRVIAKHGRRFFYNAQHDRTARLEVDERGKVWFHDDYSGKRIYTHKSGFSSRWKGFSHGGTLRSLVEAMRDYICTGQTLPPGWIGLERHFTVGNVWGYAAADMAACRAEALVLPIISKPEPGAQSVCTLPHAGTQSHQGGRHEKAGN
jgi:hypothetical protein